MQLKSNDGELDEVLLKAYVDYSYDQVTSGILDCWTDAAVETGETVQDHMLNTLRKANRLPPGYE